MTTGMITNYMKSGLENVGKMAVQSRDVGVDSGGFHDVVAGKCWQDVGAAEGIVGGVGDHYIVD